MAICALVGMAGVVVFGTLTFFFMSIEPYGVLFGSLAAAFVCVAAAFGVPTYMLRPKETDAGIPPEEEGEEIDPEADESSLAESEAEHGESDVDGNDDVVPDGDGEEESRHGQD